MSQQPVKGFLSVLDPDFGQPMHVEGRITVDTIQDTITVLDLLVPLPLYRPSNAFVRKHEGRKYVIIYEQSRDTGFAYVGAVITIFPICYNFPETEIVFRTRFRNVEARTMRHLLEQDAYVLLVWRPDFSAIFLIDPVCMRPSIYSQDGTSAGETRTSPMYVFRPHASSCLQRQVSCRMKIKTG